MNPPIEAPASPLESAPTRAALAHALAMCAVEPDVASGFYLLDDARGRFEIDREFGVITLRDEAILDAERGQIHKARVRAVEPSGTIYDLDLALRLSGMTPLVVRGDGPDSSGEEHYTL